MNADPAAQLRLLDLQAADTTLAQLAHRRRTLPALATLVQTEARAGELRSERAEVEARLADAADDQRRLENDVEAVRTRKKRDEDRLNAGGLPSKELESLQHEVATLLRRQSSLEDDLLEIMEQRETVDAELADVLARLDEVAAQEAEARSARDTAFGEIDAAIAETTAQRGVIAAEVPTDLVTLYEKVKVQNAGGGAAMIRQRRCEGCRLELSGTDLSAARSASPETVLRCDNCRRILVRTSESGL